LSVYRGSQTSTFHSILEVVRFLQEVYEKLPPAAFGAPAAVAFFIAARLPLTKADRAVGGGGEGLFRVLRLFGFRKHKGIPALRTLKREIGHSGLLLMAYHLGQGNYDGAQNAGVHPFPKQWRQCTVPEEECQIAKPAGDQASAVSPREDSRSHIRSST
jgi:hypothetical protein